MQTIRFDSFFDVKKIGIEGILETVRNLNRALRPS